MKFCFKNDVCHFCLAEHPEWNDDFEHLMIRVKDGCVERTVLDEFWPKRSAPCVEILDDCERILLCRPHFNQIDQAWVNFRQSGKEKQDY